MVVAGAVPRVTRLDNDEEPIVGDAAEAVVAEQRMRVPRQPVEEEHQAEAGGRREQDGQLEHDRDERLQREQRLAADQERVVGHLHERPDREVGAVGERLQQEADRGSGRTRAEDEPRQQGRLDAHGLVEAVHRERRAAVPPSGYKP